MLEAVFMLAGVAVAVAAQNAAWCAVFGGAATAVRLLRNRGRYTPSGRFGAANAITLARAAAVMSLPAAFALPAPIFVFLVVGLLALDSVDGRVARARGEASAFGAVLDMETDALFVMLLSLILWQHGYARAWVLITGLWRYVYVVFVALLPSLAEAPRSNAGRIVYALAVLSLAGAFLVPLLPFAQVATLLISASFGHSLLWSWKAARKSRAASAQDRDGGRPA